MREYVGHYRLSTERHGSSGLGMLSARPFLGAVGERFTGCSNSDAQAWMDSCAGTGTSGSGFAGSVSGDRQTGAASVCTLRVVGRGVLVRSIVLCVALLTSGSISAIPVSLVTDTEATLGFSSARQALLCQTICALEGINEGDTGILEISEDSRGDYQDMGRGRCRDKAVLNRHAFPGDTKTRQQFGPLQAGF